MTVYAGDAIVTNSLVDGVGWANYDFSDPATHPSINAHPIGIAVSALTADATMPLCAINVTTNLENYGRKYPLSAGGTGANLSSASGIPYLPGSGVAMAAVPISSVPAGQVLGSDGTGVPTFFDVITPTELASYMSGLLTAVTAGHVMYGTGGASIGHELNLFYDATNDRLGVGLPGTYGSDNGFGPEFPAYTASIWGDAAIYDPTAITYGSEVLTDGTFADGWAYWDGSYNMTTSGGKMRFVDPTALYPTSTLTQVSTDFATALVADHWYRLVYTLSGCAVTGTPTPELFVWVGQSDTYPTGYQTLTLSDGEHTVYLKNVDITNFFFMVDWHWEGTGGGEFYMDDASLKEVQTPATAILLDNNGTVTATTFSGNLSGTFTTANEASDTSCFPLFVTAATGDLAPKTNAALTFNSSTGALGATTFSGNLSGTFTVANEATDTTCFPLFVTAATGDLGPKSNAALTLNSSTVALGANVFALPTTTSTAGQITSNGSRVFHTYGTNNLFIGPNAGNFTLTAIQAVGIGGAALDALTDGEYNLAIGYNAGGAITSGDYNVAIGAESLATITTAASCVAIGAYALNATTGGGNFGIGYYALANLSSGLSNVAIGYQAGRGVSTLTTGSSNIFIGSNAGYSIRAGGGNTAIGSGSCYLLTSGARNIFLGYQSGQYHTTESYIFIVDSVGRASQAVEVTNSLLYGVMNAAVASQTLRINAATSIYQAFNVNPDAGDFDSLIQGDTATALFKTDAGLDAVQIGTTTAGVIADFRAAEIVFNDAAGDTPDFRVEGTSEDKLFLIDASADTIRMGDGDTNYVQVDKTGHLTLVGTATAWEDLRIEPTARTAGTNAPTFEKWYDDSGGTSRGVYLYSFDDAITNNEKEVHFTMQMPHAWAGTAIGMHVHWVGAVADTTAAPIWGLEYAWKDIGQVFGDTTIVYTDGSNYTDVGTDADITAHKHYISKFTAITPGTSADGISSILVGRLFRFSGDATDTYNEATAPGAKCGLLYIDAHFEVNTFGSNTEYSKA